VSTIFCDTSGFYALLDSSEERHERAAQLWLSLRERRTRLTTTNYVFAEVLSLVQKRLGMQKIRILVDVFRSSIDLQFVDAPLHELALTELLAAGRRHLSFVDCSSFAFMRRARIKTYFGFDKDFADRGFVPYALPTSAEASRE
jgi:uncharacterized protein